jgi:hypothetical protein
MALSKKLQQQEGQEAVAEYKAQQKATREKTVRLQALRLARDAAPSKAKPAAADVSLRAEFDAKTIRRNNAENSAPIDAVAALAADAKIRTVAQTTKTKDKEGVPKAKRPRRKGSGHDFGTNPSSARVFGLGPA